VLTGGQVAGLIVAVFFAIAVVVLSIILFKLGKVLEETQRLVSGITDKTVPLLGEVTTSVTHVNQELVRVDAITANVQSMTGNVSALTSLFAATLGSPIIKVAAFSYGVRSVAHKRAEKDVNRRVREELKSTRKARR
jgi:predicted PurR-regulated permease PerM